MCSRFLKVSNPNERHRFTEFIDRQFNRLRNGYDRLLRGALNFLPVVLVLAIIILGSNYFLFASSKSELAPQEDQGFLIAMLTAAPDATLQQTQLYSLQLAKILTIPEIEHLFQVEGFFGLNSGFAGLVLKPWDKRNRTTRTLQPDVQNRIGRSPAQMRWFFSPRLCPARAMGFLCNLSLARPNPLPGSMKFRGFFWKRRMPVVVHVRGCRPQNRQAARPCWRWTATN